MLLNLNFNFTRTVCCCSLGCNGSGSDWIVSLIDPYKVPQAQTEMDGFLAGCNDVYKPSVPGWSTPFNYFSSTVAAGQTSLSFLTYTVDLMCCPEPGARSGPELFLKDAINWSYFKLICQVIEPTTDQRFNIQEGKVTIWVWELLPLTRDKNHYCDNTLHFASYYLLHTFHCCTFGNTFDWFSEWVAIITYNKFVLCLLKEKKQIENKTKEKNRKSIGMDFFSLFNV